MPRRVAGAAASPSVMTTVFETAAMSTPSTTKSVVAALRAAALQVGPAAPSCTSSHQVACGVRLKATQSATVRSTPSSSWPPSPGTGALDRSSRDRSLARRSAGSACDGGSSRPVSRISGRLLTCVTWNMRCGRLGARTSAALPVAPAAGLRRLRTAGFGLRRTGAGAAGAGGGKQLAHIPASNPWMHSSSAAVTPPG